MDPVAMKIAFLNLDPASKDNVLKSLNLEDLFIFSLISKRTRRLVKTHTSQYTKKLWMNIQITNREISLHNTYMSHYWIFANSRTPGALEVENPTPMKVSGVEIDFYRFPEQFCVISDMPQVEFLAVVNHLKKAFACTLNDFKFGLKDTDDINLYFENRFLKTARSLEVGYGAVTQEEMTRFLDEFPAAKKRFVCYPGRQFLYDKPISTASLLLNEAQWFTRQNLLNLDCQKLELRKTLFKAADFNSFLINWLSNEDQKLQYLVIHGKDEPAFRNMSIITEGIPTMLGTPKRAAATTYRAQNYNVPNYELGVDIRRRSDGMLATCMVQDQHRELCTFVFVVWQAFDPSAV